MAKTGSRNRTEVKRSSARRDLFHFGIPALVVFFVGLVVCAADGFYEESATDLFNAIAHRDVGLVDSARIAGLFVFVAGLTTMVVAQVTLKRSYSATLIVREDHELVTHGIYKIIRHPIYLGSIVGICVGIPLFAQSLLGFLILLVLIPIVFSRIRMEEALLIEEYRDTYRVYQERTPKLIPFLY